MPEIITCPHCQRRLHLPASTAVQTGPLICPGCRGEIGRATPAVTLEPWIPEVIPVAETVPAHATPTEQTAHTWAQVTGDAPRRRAAPNARFHPLLKLGAVAAVLVFISLVVIIAKGYSDGRANRSWRPADRPDDAQARADVIAALGEEKPLTDQEFAAELRVVFDGLGKALRDRDQTRIGAHFDANRMLEEIGSLKMLPPEAARNEPAFARGMLTGLAGALEKQAPVLAWTEFEIRKADQRGGLEAVVICRHRNLEGATLKMRWWLVQRPSGWKIYDMEDLDMGTRISTSAASLFGMGRGNMQDINRTVALLREARQAISVADLDSAEQKLRQVGNGIHPPFVESLRQTLTSVVHIQRGRYQEALQACDRAEQARKDIPALDELRGTAYNGLSQWEKAHQHLTTYRDLLGDDPHLCCQLGLALRGLRRFAEAATVYRRGLDLDPKHADALAGLVNSLENGTPHDDLGPRFARLDNPHENFTVIADDCRPQRDGECLEPIALAMQKIDPKFGRADFELALARVWTGKAKQAPPLFLAALQKEPDADTRRQYLVVFCQEMARMGRALEAYAVAPDARTAYRELADTLKSRSDKDDLRILTARHGKAHPDDPVMLCFRAQELVDDEQYDLADQAFAAAIRAKVDGATLAEFRMARVRARYHVGQALAAYRDIGPRPETFRQLISLCEVHDNDAALAALLAAHAKDEPDSVEGVRHECRHLIKQKQYPAAVARFKAAIGKAKDEDQRSTLQEEFCEVMANAGQAITAYEAAPDAKAAFDVLASELQDREDLAELGKLVALHRQKEPGDVMTLYYEAEPLIRADKWEPACKLLGQALAQVPPEQQQRVRSRYVYLMVKAGQAVAAYAEAGPAHRDAVFAQAANLLRWDKQEASLRELLDARRAHAPGDPEVLFLEAQVRMLAKQPAAATPFLADACRRQTDETKRRSYITQFVQQMDEADEALAGYRAAPDALVAFDWLAASMLRKKDDRQLADLIAEHGKKHGATAGYHRYQGELHLLRGEVDAALRELTAAQALMTSQERAANRNTLLRVRVMAGQAVAVFREGGATRNAFGEIANVCMSEQNAAQLAAVLALYRLDEPDDPWLPAWDLELHWLQKDYDGVVQVFAKHRQALLAAPNLRRKYADYLVRGLIHLKRPQEAMREAKALAEKKHGSTLLPVLAHAAAGDVKQTLAALEVHGRYPYQVDECYRDADLGPLLRSPAFAPVRAKFPERNEELPP